MATLSRFISRLSEKSHAFFEALKDPKDFQWTYWGKYSGIEFLQTPDRTPASGSPLEGTPVPRIPAGRNPGSPLRSTPGLVPRTTPFPRENGKLPIKRTFHISEYGRV